MLHLHYVTIILGTMFMFNAVPGSEKSSGELRVMNFTPAIFFQDWKRGKEPIVESRNTILPRIKVTVLTGKSNPNL